MQDLEDDPEMRQQIHLYKDEKAESDWDSDDGIKKEELVTECKEPVIEEDHKE